MIFKTNRFLKYIIRDFLRVKFPKFRNSDLEHSQNYKITEI